MDVIANSKIKKMSPLLLVADIDRSIEFYITKLDFEIDFRYEDFYAGITKDGFSIHLKIGKPSMDKTQNKRDNENVDIIFSVEDIEYLYKEFLNRSVEMIQPLREMPYGKEFYIADPDSYIMAFLETA